MVYLIRLCTYVGLSPTEQVINTPLRCSDATLLMTGSATMRESPVSFKNESCFTFYTI